MGTVRPLISNISIQENIIRLERMNKHNVGSLSTECDGLSTIGLRLERSR